MGNYLKRLLPILIIVFSFYCIKTQTIIPFTDYNIGLPDSLFIGTDNLSWSPDCGNHYYTMNGYIEENSRFVISKNQCSTMDKNLIYFKMCDLLDAYGTKKRKRIKNVMKLYSTEYNKLDSLLKIPEFKSKFYKASGSISNFDVKLAYQINDTILRFYVLTDFEDVIISYTMINEENNWLFANTNTELPYSHVIWGFLLNNEPKDMIVDKDIDKDGYDNLEDNCKCKSNGDQQDSDQDDKGDICDNCQDQFNPDQSDIDEDGIGDICDNCMYKYNPDQADENDNGIGDVCE